MPKTRMLTEQKSNHWKHMIKETSKYQLNISLLRREKTLTNFICFLKRSASEATCCEETLSMQDQICKAKTLWAMKTAKEDFPFWVSDGVSQLFQRIFPDSVVDQKMTMSCTKVSYVISHGVGPYFLQKTIDDILSSPDTYYAIL